MKLTLDTQSRQELHEQLYKMSKCSRYTVHKFEVRARGGAAGTARGLSHSESKLSFSPHVCASRATDV